MALVVELLDPDIRTVQGLLSPEECADLIARAEAIGFAVASVTTRTGQQMLPDIRNNDRVDLFDAELLAFLWQRASAVLPSERDGVPLAGLHPRLRFYRYDPGQRFKRHRDGRVKTDDGRVSRFTFLVYLNADCVGGETIFTNYDLTGAAPELRRVVVTPAVGLGLCFLHDLWHEGAEIVSGRKYVLRADVLFAGQP